jgi:hypothetical protein
MTVVRALAEQEQNAATLARMESHVHVQRGAGIQPRPEFPLEREVAQRVWSSD